MITPPEPVAEVGGVFTLYWVGSGPIAPICEKHNIKVGTKLVTESQLKQAVRDALEEAAQFCESNQVNIAHRKGRIFLPFCKEGGGVHEGMDFAKAIRALIKEIPE